MSAFTHVIIEQRLSSLSFTITGTHDTSLTSYGHRSTLLSPRTSAVLSLTAVHSIRNIIFRLMSSNWTVLQYYSTTCYCLSNAIHCMGQNIKSLAACVCVCARAHGYWGPNISKTVRDRGSVTMGHQ